jgi:holo-[acyl-carrier protein] synthase
METWSGVHTDVLSAALGERILGVGIDCVDVGRFAEALGRRPGFAQRVFCQGELDHCAHEELPRGLAARFAAREAFVKALGVGLWAIDLRDVEVLSLDGRPVLQLYGRAARAASAAGAGSWLLSLTHTDLVAVAVVVALS